MSDRISVTFSPVRGAPVFHEAINEEVNGATSLVQATPQIGFDAASRVGFVASPAASAAYLTVSETFPIEMRAVAIAVFYAIGTGIGGAAAPAIFGHLIESGSRENVFYGYLFGAAMMGTAAVLAACYAVKAEGRALEDVAQPLSAVSSVGV